MRKEGPKILTLTVSIILLITSLATGIWSIIRYISLPQPEGTVLTCDFIERCAGKQSYSELIICCIVALLFGIFGVAMSFKEGKYYSLGEKYFFALFWLITAAVTISIFAVPVIKKLTHKPQIETVQVTGRSVRWGRSFNSYIFTFSNGASENVSREEYNIIPDDTTYYVIMNGDKCTGAFNASCYSLPEQN